jgi:putative transposase
MISAALRNDLRVWINEAVAAGARRFKACAIVGITLRCLLRWRDDDVDRRSTRVQVPKNSLSEAEVQAILTTVNQPEFAHLPPTQIVPMLADKGTYLGSERTFYRVMKSHEQLTPRRVERLGRKRGLPLALTATGPNQVASWDVTYLPSAVHGQFWYLYAVQDLFSRKIVAWQVYASESGEHASELMHDYVIRESIAPGTLTLHADNGAVMKGSTLYASLQKLGIAKTHSRPGVSNDNAFIEAFFRTIKYRPDNRVKPFVTLQDARQFADKMMHWFNNEHRHSAIRFVTPAQRHSGADTAILARRQEVYEQARALNPSRWSGQTRNWVRISEVKLNPHRVEQVHAKIVRKTRRTTRAKLSTFPQPTQSPTTG